MLTSSKLQGLPPKQAFVVRDAYVMTMDPALGDQPETDILVENGHIVSIGRQIEAGAAEVIAGKDMIALPGFIDTHWHLWNSTLRGLIDYLHAEQSYFPLTMRLGPLCMPADAYINVKLAVAEALLSGITTLHNWAHNVRSPTHADAEIRALSETGIRARFSYGWGQDLPVGALMNSADVARVKSEWFAQNDLLHLGVALRTPVAYQRGNVPIDILRTDIQKARELNLPITMHNRQGAVTLLDQNGLLASDFLLVHPQALTEQEIELLARKEVKISCAPVLENTRGTNGPRGPIQFSELTDAGVQWSLSVDEVATNGRADFFGVMREMLRSGWQRVGDHTPVPPRRMLEFATIEGAKALGISDQVGSLVPGKRADITLVRRTDVNMTPIIGDPSMMLVFSGQPNNVDTVFVDGRPLVRQGQLTAMNLAEICAAALESTRALRGRDGVAARGTSLPG